MVKAEFKEVLTAIARDSEQLKAVLALLDAQIQALERSMLDSNVVAEADERTLVRRKFELQGARQVRAGIFQYLHSLRNVSR